MICGDESLCLEPQSLYTTAKVIIIIIIFRGTEERNRGYALLMRANKPETALYRAPTFSLLASDGGFVHGTATKPNKISLPIFSAVIFIVTSLFWTQSGQGCVPDGEVYILIDILINIFGGKYCIQLYWVGIL